MRRAEQRVRLSEMVAWKAAIIGTHHSIVPSGTLPSSRFCAPGFAVAAGFPAGPGRGQGMPSAGQRAKAGEGPSPSPQDLQASQQDGDERKPSRARRRAHGGAGGCSLEDAFWWLVALVAALVLVNYAYYNLSNPSSFRGHRGWLGTKENDPGGCHCTGDSFGEHCRGVVGRTKIYLPTDVSALHPCVSKDFWGSVDLSHYFTGKDHLEAAGRSDERLWEAHAIQEVVEHLENPVHCTHGHTQFAVQVYSIPARLPLVSAVPAALLSLSEATRAAKGFQLVPQEVLPVRGGREFCKTSSRLSCLLEPPNTCGAVGAKGSRQLDLTDPMLEIRRPPRDSSATGLPVRFQHLGAYWYWTELLKRVWRPNKASTTLISLLEEHLGTKGKQPLCAFVHSCKSQASKKQMDELGGCAGSQAALDRIMPAVGELGERYNVSTVFLVSDDLRAIAATPKYDKLSFRHLIFASGAHALERLEQGVGRPPAAQWLGGTKFREAARVPEYTPAWAAELVEAHPDLREFAELELMSRCSAFVGSFNDPLLRLGYQLAVARKGYFPPYVSVDDPLQLPPPPHIKA